MKNCVENCQWAYKGDKKTPPHCRRYPPQPMVVPTQNRITQQQEMQVLPLPHPLLPLGICGEFKAALTIEQ